MLRQIYTQIVSPYLDILTAKRFDTEGFYTLRPSDAIDPYKLWLPGRGGFQRRRIRGELEPDVLDILVKRVNPGDTVFDVGAAWGYFRWHSARSARQSIHWNWKKSVSI
jgi:hypothetical protein